MRLVLALMPAAVFLLLRQNYTLALDVTLNGEHLAYVAEKAHLDAVTVSVEQLATHHLGVPYQIPGTFGYLMQRVDSLEKTLMLRGIGGRRRRGDDRG